MARPLFWQFKRCACETRPGLVKAQRITTPNNTMDVNHFERVINGKTAHSSTTDMWPDTSNGQYPILPFCRKRWLPQVKESIKRFIHA